MKSTICIMDEDPVEVLVLADHLKSAGHRVVAFGPDHSSERTPATPINKGQSCIVVCGFRSGLAELWLKQTESIKSNFPGSPIVALSQSDLPFTLDVALAAGIWAYLRKPVFLTEAELIIKHIINKLERNDPAACESMNTSAVTGAIGGSYNYPEGKS